MEMRIDGTCSILHDDCPEKNLEDCRWCQLHVVVEDYRQRVYKMQEEAIKWSSKNEKDMYNAGLNDAWELAKKLFGYSCDTKLCCEDLKNIFGSACEMDILRNNTPQEAIAKLEAYEREQEKFKIGEIVKNRQNGKLFLLITEEDGCPYNFGVVDVQKMVVDRIICDSRLFKKTGKHIDIQSILNQIGGEAE